MNDYLKYYLSPLTQVLAAVGFLLGGHYVWIALSWFPLMAVLDSLMKPDYSVRKMRNRTAAYIPVWISTLMGPVLVATLAWAFGHHELTLAQQIGAVIGCAWLSVLPLVPAAHELYHARGKIGKTVARYAQVCYLDATRMEAHVVGHHIDVGTPEDSDTAPRGETLYTFSPKAVVKSTIQAQQFIGDALVKKGYARWGIRHGLWRAILALGLFLALLHWIGGTPAVVASVCSMILARFWIETFNYFQHYGQVRVPGSPIEKRHVWNHFGPLSRLLAFEITNHADHHLNSYQTYYTLVPHKESVRMPSVFVCFLAALVPPIWFNSIIKPALREWDLKWANAEERALAAEQNRRAGWEDWFSEAPRATHKTATAAG